MKRNKRSYSRKFKLNAVESYLTKELSCRDIANQLDIDAPALLTSLVLKYKKYGTETFKNDGERQNIIPMSKNLRIRELEIHFRRTQIEIGCLIRLQRLREVKLIEKK
ncbi:transposase [Lactococcus lactis]|uniref:transposase n=1 Tax=Lactococcus lactis TaxID=1358 RepID=UPI00128F7683